MRSLISFPCLGNLLVGTLDSGSGNTGLLVVSDGNEIRSGPHRSMAQLAHRIAAAGYPVFRFDRRGVGDSAGPNEGFLGSASDIATAAATFRREAKLQRLVAFGNGDAASALALFHTQARIDALLLANPVTTGPALDPAEDAEAARPVQGWMRRIIGRAAARPEEPVRRIVGELATALTQAEVPITVLLATRDPIAAEFADALHRPALSAAATRIRRKQCDTASHVFAGTDDKAWLYERVIEALAEQRAP